MSLPVKITADYVFVKTPYHSKDFVKETLNGVWSKAEGMYRFPKNIHAMRELMKSFPQLITHPEFVEAGKRLVAVRDTALQLKKSNVVIDPRLRPYQNTDIAYLKKMPCAGIFNEPRTGKTPTSIVLMKELGTINNLVICPASLALNWGKEFATWFPEMVVFEVIGTPKKREKIYKEYAETTLRGIASVLIISKDTWKGDYLIYGLSEWNFDTCFVDEAHFLRNYDTAQSGAVKAVKAQRRYALTGTPTVKHSKDIFGILTFLYPSKFTSYWQFVERYFIIQEDRWSKNIGEPKPERVQELQELIGFISVQRKRQEVMSWLPDKEKIPFYCRMEKKQEKLYDQMLDDFCTWDEEDESEDAVVMDASNVLSQLTRLRQICLDPRLLGFDVVGCKTKALLEWLDDNREPVVIMSMFTSYLKMVKADIESLGLNVGMIIGEMSNAEKEKAKVDFQEGRLDVLLCNIISAGVGFTLDRAETILFLDKAWNPADNEQAEDRITPTTEERNHKHTIISFVVDGTVDEKINRILDEKKSLTDYVNEGGIQALKKLLS